MPSSGPADIAWLTNVRDTFGLIQNHIPISDVALVVQDYLATPMPRYSSQCCFRCNAYHRRHISNLCMQCVRVCVICDKLEAANEKDNWCNTCEANPNHKHTINLLTSIHRTQTKSEIYGSWYHSRFYSDILKDVQNQRRREAADPVLQAQKAELDRKKAEFSAIENAKSFCDRFIECRTKLWDAYAEINELRAKYPSAKIAAKPEFPFY